MKNTIKNTMLGISIFLSMSLPLLVLAEGNSGESTGFDENTQKCLYKATVLGYSQVEPNGEETINVSLIVVGPVNMIVVVELNNVVKEEGDLMSGCASYVGDMKLIQVEYNSESDLFKVRHYEPGQSIEISFESRQPTGPTGPTRLTFEKWTILRLTL